MSEINKPVKFPRWASTLIKNNISNELNIYEPPEEKKDIGWEYEEVPPRQWFNWLFKTICDWLEYLNYSLHRPKIYTKSNLPSAKENKALTVFISDIDGGIIAYSNGINWKKINTGENL